MNCNLYRRRINIYKNSFNLNTLLLNVSASRFVHGCSEVYRWISILVFILFVEEYYTTKNILKTLQLHSYYKSSSQKTQNCLLESK